MFLLVEDSMCSDSNLVYNTLDPEAKAIKFDEEVKGKVGCNEYVYYTIEGNY